MLHHNRWLTVILLVGLALQLVGCNAPAVTAEEVEPYSLEALDNGINRVILAEKAAQRLGVQTSAVREEQLDGGARKVVPYGALIYDLNGGTWIYVSPEPLTFVRTAVAVDYIEGDMVVLAEGPDIGTEVATVAVAELYGTDTGVGK